MRALSASLISLALLAGSTFAVAAQDGATEATHISGVVTGMTVSDPGTSADAGGVRTDRGVTAEMIIDWDDPRLGSSIALVGNYDHHPMSGAAVPPYVAAGSVNVEGPDGSWVGTTQRIGFADGSSRCHTVVHGTDAYEGLSAAVDGVFGVEPPFVFEGLIFEGEMPPFPEPSSFE